MSGFFSALASFFTPVLVFFTSVGGIVTLVLWAIAQPASAVNLFICKIIDLIASVLPSTPSAYTVSGIIASIGSAMPAIGTNILGDVVGSLGYIFGLRLVITVYKLIPFKAS